jgi:hypothetical protein
LTPSSHQPQPCRFAPGWNGKSCASGWLILVIATSRPACES